MIDREDTDRMLHLANVDLNAIRNMLDHDLFEDSVFGYRSQLAVEKAFKVTIADVVGGSTPKRKRSEHKQE
jgi:hypothetical protein